MSKALRDVTNERRRQIAAEGWTPEHDDQHKLGELAIAGASYAVASGFPADNEPPPYGWPWDKAWWKPTTTRQNLIKAAALLVAEIERIDRANGVPASVYDWRALDTAPRDEKTRATVILALKDGRVVVGKWLDNSKSPMPWQGWSTNAGPVLADKVAFWQPLPEAPAIAGRVAGSGRPGTVSTKHPTESDAALQRGQLEPCSLPDHVTTAGESEISVNCRIFSGEGAPNV